VATFGVQRELGGDSLLQWVGRVKAGDSKWRKGAYFLQLCCVDTPSTVREKMQCLDRARQEFEAESRITIRPHVHFARTDSHQSAVTKLQERLEGNNGQRMAINPSWMHTL